MKGVKKILPYAVLFGMLSFNSMQMPKMTFARQLSQSEQSASLQKSQLQKDGDSLKEKIRSKQDALDSINLRLAPVEKGLDMYHHVQNTKAAIWYADSSSTCREKGDYEKAIEYATKAIELEPDSSSNYRARGLAYGLAGSNPFFGYSRLARADFEKAVELSKNEEERSLAQHYCDDIQQKKNEYYLLGAGIVALLGTTILRMIRSIRNKRKDKTKELRF